MEKARPERQAFLHFGLSSPSTLKAERFRLVVRYHVSVLRFQVHLAGLELKLRYICSCSDLLARLGLGRLTIVGKPFQMQVDDSIRRNDFPYRLRIDIDMLRIDILA